MPVSPVKKSRDTTAISRASIAWSEDEDSKWELLRRYWRDRKDVSPQLYKTVGTFTRLCYMLIDYVER